MLDGVTIVIRSVGERTEAACLESILRQNVDPSQVVIVREAPFSRAMLVGYQAGVNAGRPWTLCIDADVILRPGSIEALLSHASRQLGDVFEIQGFVLDKLLLSIREAGNHMFRTGLLPELIACIPEEGCDVRPEASAMRSMVKRGYRWVSVPYVVGLHDFGQSNRDLFRKSFTHGKKHLHLIPELLPKMRQRANLDTDFAVVIDGIAEGLRAHEDVRIDIRHRPFDERFIALNIPEKQQLTSSEFGPDEVEQTLREWAASGDIMVRGIPTSAMDAIDLDANASFSGFRRAHALWRKKRKEVAFVRAMLVTIAHGLEALARRLRTTRCFGL